MYFIGYVFPETHWSWDQAQLTLDLIRDCSRFVFAFFEVINVSAPHIYHSALTLSPSTSLIRGLYKHHASPLARIVKGLSLSWELAVATTYLGPRLSGIVWSPCSKLIAAKTNEFVAVLDVATLNRLATFKHPLGHCNFSFSPDGRFLTLFTTSGLISWDIQTGGRLSEILLKPVALLLAPTSFTYSKDGKMVAVALETHGRYVECLFYTFHLPSRTRLGPLRVPDGRFVFPIWTHDKYLRFALMHPGSITIWEVEFTLLRRPTKVESFPFPDEVIGGDEFLFLPDLYRLAFTLRDTIQVLDVKTSKLLLKSEQASGSYQRLSFSSDGRFFAFSVLGQKVRIWKESPAGYAPHQQLPFTLNYLAPPLLSPNGRSIIFPLGGTINLWHTDDQILSPPSPPTEEHDSQGHFLLAFSPCEKSAGFAQLHRNVVTTLDLRSGDLRSTIDTGMRVECLGVDGDTVVVIDEGKIVTWNLPGGDRAFNASISDSVRTVMFGSSPPPSCSIVHHPTHVSLSPDLSRIAVRPSLGSEFDYPLEIYNATTGTRLASTIPHAALSPQFTRDGREVWIASFYSRNIGLEIIEGDVSGAMELKPLEETLYPSRAFLWHSIRGYKVTDDGWVLSPTQKRLLWLPHRWRSDQEEHRLWSGRFLGLTHRVSEGVILEFLE